MTVKLLEIQVEDDVAKQEIIDAFHAIYMMPVDENGAAIYTGEEFVVHHCQNLIRDALVQYKVKQKEIADKALRDAENQAAKQLFIPQGRELEAAAIKEAKKRAKETPPGEEVVEPTEEPVVETPKKKGK